MGKKWCKRTGGRTAEKINRERRTEEKKKRTRTRKNCKEKNTNKEQLRKRNRAAPHTPHRCTRLASDRSTAFRPLPYSTWRRKSQSPQRCSRAYRYLHLRRKRRKSHIRAKSSGLNFRQETGSETGSGSDLY